MKLRIKNEELRIEKGELNHVKNYSLFIINSKLARRAAFTLAEVLITLGIIGVVAALTMPTLIANYQKHETITKLKKVYSTLSQAFKLSEVQNDNYEYWERYDDIGALPYVEKYWLPFFNGAKICKNYTECGYTEEQPWLRKYELKFNRSITNDNAHFTLPDGTFIFVLNDMLVVDLNGGYKPNKLGKDVFAFQETNAGILPLCHGAQYEYSDSNDKDMVYNRCSKESGDGLCCAARLIEVDDWQIKDDYPW